MNIDQLRQRFPDEQACRSFFESVLWQKGRYCPCATSLIMSTFGTKTG